MQTFAHVKGNESTEEKYIIDEKNLILPQILKPQQRNNLRYDTET